MSEVRCSSSRSGLVRKFTVTVEADAAGATADVTLPSFRGSIVGVRKIGPSCSVELRGGLYDFLQGAGADLPHGRSVRMLEQDAPGAHPDVELDDEIIVHVEAAPPMPHAHFLIEIFSSEDLAGVTDALLLAVEHA